MKICHCPASQSSCQYLREIWVNIGGSRGRFWARPQGSRFFRFDIQNFRNIIASGVHAPLRGLRTPLREILDPPLVNVTFCSPEVVH